MVRVLWALGILALAGVLLAGCTKATPSPTPTLAVPGPIIIADQQGRLPSVALLEALPRPERECLDGSLGPDRLETVIRYSGTPTEEAAVQRCISQDTRRRLHLGQLVGALGTVPGEELVCLSRAWESSELGIPYREAFPDLKQAGLLYGGWARCLSDPELARLGFPFTDRFDISQARCLFASLDPHSSIRMLYTRAWLRLLSGQLREAVERCGVSLQPLPDPQAIPLAVLPSELGGFPLLEDPEVVGRLFQSLPPEVTGKSHMFRSQSDASGPILYRTYYSGQPGLVPYLRAENLSEKDEPTFSQYPPGTTAGLAIAMFAGGFEGEVMSVGRHEGLVWVVVSFKTLPSEATSDTQIYWGVLDSPWMFEATAQSPEDAWALAKAFVEVARNTR